MEIIGVKLGCTGERIANKCMRKKPGRGGIVLNDGMQSRGREEGRER